MENSEVNVLEKIIPKKNTDTDVDRYEKYCKPKLVQLLKAIDLDIVYKKASGNHLWRAKNERLTKVLDLAGGYGANLFGHNHMDIKSRLIELYTNDTPFLAQASCRSGAALLAEKLNAYAHGEFVTIFTNSGTETVEAALKHAYLKHGKPIFMAIKGGFHGKTLGSIQLTSSYSAPFKALGFPVFLLDFDDPKTWASAEAMMDQVSGIIFEPILGEGGIRALPQDFVQWLQGMRARHQFSLIADEIQSGIGRTGEFFAFNNYTITPDCICLSKSLGGGLVKIGALMIHKKHFVDEFAIIHTSTFAEDDISCLTALKALEILDRDQLIIRSKLQGAYFLKKLKEVQKRFPKQIKAIRGKGLMIGIELFEREHSSSNILNMLSVHKYLGYAVCSYLLNIHDIRLAPTLSQPYTLRIAPSAYITESEIDFFITAFTQLCQVLDNDDGLELTCFNKESLKDSNVFMPKRTTRKEVSRVPNKVAFIGHFIEAEDAILWDPSLAQIKTSELAGYLNKTSSIIGPTILDEIHVKSRTNQEVHLSFIGLNLTSKQIVHAMETKNTPWINEKINEAIQIAKDRGCKVMGFGGYTSILTKNCCSLRDDDIAFTTGNSFTVGMGIMAIKEAAKNKEIDLKEASLAVIGATGNIASVYALIMAPEVKEIVLVVRRLATAKLKVLIQKIKQTAPETCIKVTDTMDGIQDCSLILAASNTKEAIIYPRHLHHGAVVICDIALPFDVAPEVAIERPDVQVIQGGIVRLPDDSGNENFKISGIPLDYGHAFACMSETLIMGLEHMTTNGSYGKIAPEQVKKVLELAHKHGFQLANYKTERSY